MAVRRTGGHGCVANPAPNPGPLLRALIMTMTGPIRARTASECPDGSVEGRVLSPVGLTGGMNDWSFMFSRDRRERGPCPRYISCGDLETRCRDLLLIASVARILRTSLPGHCNGSRITCHIFDIRLLAAERSARFLVGVRGLVGSVSDGRSDDAAVRHAVAGRSAA